MDSAVAPISRPRLSVIVCTRNRGVRLNRFLDQMRQLVSPPGGWELVLVDNASSDGTPAVIEGFTRQAPMSCHHVHAPQCGLARARNVGLAAARGEILVFTDDDCYPSPDYLCSIAKVFDECAPAFIGGRVVLHDPTDAAVTVRDFAEPFDIPEYSYVSSSFIAGANMAIARHVFEDIGGFDPHLGAGTPSMAGEDIDIVARAVWAGWSGRYDPRPVVAHDHGRKPGRAAVRQSRGYDYGRGAYLAKRMFDSRARPVYLRRWAGRIFRRPGLATISRARREVTGALRYLIERSLHPEPVPRVYDNRSTDLSAPGPMRTRQA